MSIAISRFKGWNSVKVKAQANYICQECGSTEYLQAHDPTGKHNDWHTGICLCAKCHATKHPTMSERLFLVPSQQPYWTNISASTLAKQLGCHNRTIIRRARKFGIASMTDITQEDIQKLQILFKRQPRIKYKRSRTLTIKPIILKILKLTINAMVFFSKLKCPECNGTKIHKAGFNWSGRKKVQKYRCQDCGRTTINPSHIRQSEPKE